MNEFLAYNRIGSVAKERAPAYVAEVKKTEMKAPVDRVQEVAPQTTQISLKKEETPLKHQTDLYIKTAEVIEKGEKVEKKLDDSADVITRFKKVASEQDPTKKLAEKEEFIRKFDSYKKETDQSNIENTHRTKTTSYEQELVARTAEHKTPKVSFKKEKIDETDEAGDQESHESPEISFDKKKSSVRSVADQSEDIKPVRTEETPIKTQRADAGTAGREEIVASQEKTTIPNTDSENENNVSLGDLVEGLRSNLTAKKEITNEKRAISFENTKTSQAENSPPPPLPALSKAEFDLDKVDNLLYQSQEKSKELVKVISDTPVAALNSGLPPQLLNYLDRTLNDIKETRVTMKQMKQSYESTAGKEVAVEPRAELKTIDKIEDAKKIIREITQAVSPDNFRKAQQIITPEAVSQLLF